MNQILIYEIVEITTTVSQILYKDIPKYGILLSVGRSGKTTAESKIILPKKSLTHRCLFFGWKVKILFLSLTKI